RRRRAGAPRQARALPMGCLGLAPRIRSMIDASDQCTGLSMRRRDRYGVLRSIDMSNPVATSASATSKPGLGGCPSHVDRTTLVTGLNARKAVATCAGNRDRE